MRTRCQLLIAGLDIPEPFDLGEFCLRLERTRGRSISLIPVATVPGGPCGMWVRTAESDYVFYDEATSSPHRQHIIMHEIGHILFGHRDAADPGGDLRALLLPALDPELVRSVLGRGSYGSVQELEAETFAGLMSLTVNPLTSRDPGTARLAPPEQAEIISRIERTVGTHPNADSWT